VILADACGKLRQYSIEDTRLHRGQVDAYVSRSLMLVTALATGYIGAADFDRIVNPAAMAAPARTSALWCRACPAR